MLENITHLTGENISEIAKDQLLVTAENMLFDNYRFVTATCVDNGDETFDVIYHFDRDMQLRSFRIKVAKAEDVMSISKIYFSAVLVENEMIELFGLKVSGMVLDFEGHLLLSEGAPDAPMAKRQIEIVKKGGLA